MIRKFLRDEKGNTAVEYALLSVLFVLGIVGTWSFMGNTLGDFMSEVAVYFSNQVN
ncbi:MAG: Flp family type IVb pilin [Phyllobacteriaceae bacterium]|nr:Flp family type IVb pilin [Phyllobacteriaceae bacterium]